MAWSLEETERNNLRKKIKFKTQIKEKIEFGSIKQHEEMTKIFFIKVHVNFTTSKTALSPFRKFLTKFDLKLSEIFKDRDIEGKGDISFFD